MTATPTDHAPRHRVGVAAARMREVAGDVAEASVWSMDPAEAEATLVELTRLEAQVAALKLRVAGHLDTLVEVDVAARWAHATRQTPRACRTQLRLAHTLQAHARVADALAHGRLLLDQAQAITHALDQLPTGLPIGLSSEPSRELGSVRLGPADLVRAEEHLVARAAEHHAKALRVLGRRLVEVIAPDHADAVEAALLEREEARAAQACRLTMTEDGHGTTHGRFTLPTRHAAMLRKMLLTLASPRHQDAHQTTEQAEQAVQGGDVADDEQAAEPVHRPGPVRRPGPQRLGRALCELIETYPTQRLPDTGGVCATVVVTMTLETLEGRLDQAGMLDTGERISPGEARRLACEAALIPAVLGGPSEVLDLGRRRRLHTRAQRTAMMLRDHHCTHPGCDWPPGLCHAHHDTPWSHGGPTDLANGRLLCPRHHTEHHRTEHHRRE